jgi:hypothetical protein
MPLSRKLYSGNVLHQPSALDFENGIKHTMNLDWSFMEDIFPDQVIAVNSFTCGVGKPQHSGVKVLENAGELALPPTWV